MAKDEIQKEIESIEATMSESNFWDDKVNAQKQIARHQELKDELKGVGKYDRGPAVMTIFSGAGGDDAEDFSRILVEMYQKYFDDKSWSYSITHKNENDHGGYRNITMEIEGKGVYGKLKNESGVHRLVRISPFNAKKLRHTSFSMVEVIPKFDKTADIEINDEDLEIEYSKSGGPGGQNVNKRETAVRIIHKDSGITVHADSERSQHQNKERAMNILKGKLYRKLEAEREGKQQGMYVSKTTDIEWGNQIRSYVFHPYKMVKDHRTNVEIRDVESVLKGEIEPFIEAEKEL